jgi:hypothetical protein
LQGIVLLASEMLRAVCVEDEESQSPFTPLNTKMNLKHVSLFVPHSEHAPPLLQNPGQYCVEKYSLFVLRTLQTSQGEDVGRT